MKWRQSDNRWNEVGWHILSFLNPELNNSKTRRTKS
jgi:hypothetical protein